MQRNCFATIVRNIAKAKSFFVPVGFAAALLSLVSCATSFDMSGERMTPLGPEWGVVVGSVLVQLEDAPPGKKVAGRDVSDSTYEFDIVQIQANDPNGEDPYAKRYRLEAMAGEERLFIARVRSGQYLIKRFDEEGLTGLGGELDLVFSSMAGEVRYIGRLLVKIPKRMSRGKDYRFTVENAREPTLALVSKQDAELTKDVVTVPMQVRGDEER